jgi:hypothetical protein
MLNTEDYEGLDTLISAGSMDMMFQGKKCTFYLYKAGYKTDDGMEFYLAVAGPFSTNKKDMLIDDNMSNISGITEVLYSKDNVKKALQDWIKEWESYEETTEE